MERDRPITAKRPKLYKLLKHMNKDTKENANLDIISSKKLWWDNDLQGTKLEKNNMYTEEIIFHELRAALNQCKSAVKTI